LTCSVPPLQVQQTLQQILFLFVLSQHQITPLSNFIDPGSSKRIWEFFFVVKTPFFKIISKNFKKVHMW
jgi:hypothetical protein